MLNVIAQDCTLKASILSCAVPGATASDFKCGGQTGNETTVSSLIADGQLLSASLANSTLQKIVIFGRLKVDIDYTFATGSIVVLARNNSTTFGKNISPIISDGVSFNLIGTKLLSSDQSCAALEYNIATTMNTSIKFQNSEVRNFDGLDINNNMNNIVCDNTTFSNNKSFLTQPLNVPINKIDIKNSRFYARKNNFDCISINAQSDFTFVNNEVAGYFQGIWVAENCNAVIKGGNNFHDNIYSVNLTSELGGVPTATITGNAFNNESNSIGIYGDAIAEISNNTFAKSNSLVHNLYPAQIYVIGNKTGSYNITGNNFTNSHEDFFFELRVGCITIKQSSCRGLVSGNTMNITNYSTGIMLTECTNSLIKSNNISQSANWPLINIFDSSKNKFHFNQMVHTNTGGEYNGMNFSDAPNNESRYNTITGTNGQSTNLQFAINAELSRHNTYECNSINQFARGLYAYGNNDGTDLKTNIFSNSQKSLYLLDGIIGLQLNKGNTWYNSGAIGVGGNQFRVKSTNPSYFWPNPIVPATGWFYNGGSEPNYAATGYCLENIITQTETPFPIPNPGCCTSFVDTIIKSTLVPVDTNDPPFPPFTNPPTSYPPFVYPPYIYPPYTYPPNAEGVNYDNLYFAYYDLAAYGGPYNADQSTFMTYYGNTSIGKLAQIEYETNLLLQQTNNTYEDDIKSKIQLIAYTTLTDAQLQTALTELDDLKRNKSGLNAVFGSQMSSTIGNLIARLNTLRSGQLHPISNNLAYTLLSKLKNLNAPSRIIDPQELSSLQTIANGCYKKDGRAVLKARHLLHIETSINEDCSIIRSTERQDVSLNISVYPNPAISDLHVDCDPSLSGTYTIYNAMGSQVLAGTINPKISIQDIPSGMYSIEFKTANGSKKLKFIKIE